MLDGIVNNLAFVGVIHHDPVVAVARREISLDPHVVRIHDCVAEVIAFGNIPRNHAVIGIHIMHRKPQITKAVADKFVVFRGVHKHPVAPPAHIVADHPCTWCIPDIDAVAAVIHSTVQPPLDDIANYQRILRAMDIHADQIA